MKPLNTRKERRTVKRHRSPTYQPNGQLLRMGLRSPSLNLKLKETEHPWGVGEADPKHEGSHPTSSWVAWPGRHIIRTEGGGRWQGPRDSTRPRNAIPCPLFRLPNTLIFWESPLVCYAPDQASVLHSKYSTNSEALKESFPSSCAFSKTGCLNWVLSPECADTAEPWLPDGDMWLTECHRSDTRHRNQVRGTPSDLWGTFSIHWKKSI